MFDNYKDFFEGPVCFVDQGFFRATYSINGDVNNIIKVKNSTHIRMISNQRGIFPPIFDIIAPMSAVRITRGTVPSEYIKSRTNDYYKRLRKIYQGF